MKKAYGYVRFSTAKQSSMSTDAQKLVIQNVWEKHLKDDYPTLTFCIDEDVSARKHRFEDRPEAAKLNLLAGKGDCIILSKIDRGFRDLSDALNMFNFWDRCGIRIVCPDLAFSKLGLPFYDSTNLMCRIGVIFWGLAAEIEGDRASQRDADWRASQIAQGRACTAKPPYGFKYIRRGAPQGVKMRPPAWLQPAEDEQAIGRFIVSQRLLGHGPVAIAKHLNNAGLRNREKRKWLQPGVTLAGQLFTKIVAFEKNAVPRLAEWEFMTDAGVRCIRFDKEHLIPKELRDARVPALSLPHPNQDDRPANG